MQRREEKTISKDKLKSRKDYEALFDKTPKATLDVALDIRKFEIGLYWKRATYFWVFIGASFTGYLAAISQQPSKLWLECLFACLGLIFSSAWFLVNKGSKYWQENWEHHVDLLEDLSIGPLYKHTCHKRPDKDAPWLIKIIGPRRYSVTKINSIISLYVMCIWVALLFIPWFRFISKIIKSQSTVLAQQPPYPLFFDAIALISLTIFTLFFVWSLFYKGLSKEPPEGAGVYPREISNLFDEAKSE